MSTDAPPLRVANCSGFFGDRLSAAREMVDGGPIDVLTGDWLAELTLLILAKQRQRRPDAGYAGTFVRQMEDVLADCVARGIKVVTNAGGLNPSGCARAVQEIAGRAGVDVRVAYVEGDDLLDRLPELLESGEELANTDTGEPFSAIGAPPVAANAYLGHRGITEALRQGADVVVTGRVTDAALVVGPAAWHFDWAPDDWDALAGAVVAGHVLECGCQATGGNFSFFTEVPGMAHLGFPLAELHADGSAVITKHPGTGGAVTVETVTAQLLYEIAGPRYLGPDCVARFDSIELREVGADRVLVSGVRGEPPPTHLRVAVNYLGGFKNSVSFVMGGLEVAAKAAAAEAALWDLVPGGSTAFDEVAVELVGAVGDDGAADDLVELRITVLDGQEEKVGRRFADAAVQTALSSYPGCHTAAPPTGASEYGVLWPTLVRREHVCQSIVVGGRRTELRDPADQGRTQAAASPEPAAREQRLAAEPAGSAAAEVTVEVPLGVLLGARSGDKGANANLGVWARTEAAFQWLRGFLTTDALVELLPDIAPFAVERYELDNLRACNFVLKGYLGRGVAASTRRDPQAKNLGERLRACRVGVPARLVRGEGRKRGTGRGLL